MKNIRTVIALCTLSWGAQSHVVHSENTTSPTAATELVSSIASKSAHAPTVSRRMLRQSWESYKRHFIQDDGRVIDRKGGGFSTSEGQAYALLRAVWMNDLSTFQKVLRWADGNLRQSARSDALFAWRWGERDDGSWGVIDPTAASDADQLIAFALIMAHRRFKRPLYLKRAQVLLTAIWNIETKEIAGKRYMLPGDWELPEGEATLRLNPAYYLPFAYRSFAEVDLNHNWSSLIDTSYHVFEACTSKVGLPTDWCQLNPKDGTISVSVDLFDSSGDFGFEAFRIFWTLAADFNWYQEPRAIKAIESMDWLRRYWILRRQLPSVVTVDGIPRSSLPYLGLYGAYLPSLSLVDPIEANALYAQTIKPTFNHHLWGDPEDYYAQNWVWFGLALQSNFKLPLHN